MPGRCVVGGCSAFPDVQNGLILHAIPFLNDERPEARKRRKKWIRNSSVCSRHFTENDYVRRCSFVDEVTKKPIMPRLKRYEIGINVMPSVHAEAVTKKTVTLKNAKRRMEASTATATASSTCSSDSVAEIEPEGKELQSSAVLAENNSPGLDGNNTDSVNELHELFLEGQEVELDNIVEEPSDEYDDEDHEHEENVNV
ncbi:hypothetical protein AWC38_SpisGene20891 [Stylophora pistillata]|uniref:THAP-type domain-containing protein n=1 Tax=Stylophora pistillata TaxID=50429 RepID=A0A2B4RB87_STYPI|nr:hypothetical protein AWC38_SpisGene20891 [Stylophora pistillata]